MYKSSIQCWATIGPPAKRHVAFRWQVVGGPLIVVFGSPLSPLINLKKVVKVGPPPPLDPRMNADKKSLETVFSTAIVWRQIST